MGPQFCGGPTGVLNSSIPFLPPVPSVGSGLGLSEGNTDMFLTPSVGSNESEPPVPQKEKVSSTQPAALEVAKAVNYPRSKPIPEGGYLERVCCSHLLYCIVTDLCIIAESFMLLYSYKFFHLYHAINSYSEYL